MLSYASDKVVFYILLQYFFVFFSALGFRIQKEREKRDPITKTPLVRLSLDRIS